MSVNQDGKSLPYMPRLDKIDPKKRITDPNEIKK